MSYTRHYPNNSPDYTPTGTIIQVNYAINGVDGATVGGQLDAGLLTDDQINQLCDALQKAGALLPWAGTVGIVAVQNGRRTFTVTDDTPPVNP